MKVDAEVNHDKDAARLRELVSSTGLSRVALAKRIGIGYSSLRAYLDGSLTVPYAVLACIRMIAKEGND